MIHKKVRTRKVGSFLLLSALLGGGVFLLAGRGVEAEGRFVSFQSFEDQSGEMCPIFDSDELAQFYASQSQLAAQGRAGGQAPAQSRQVDRAPLRYIKDPYPAWSSI